MPFLATVPFSSLFRVKIILYTSTGLGLYVCPGSANRLICVGLRFEFVLGNRRSRDGGSAILNFWISDDLGEQSLNRVEHVEEFLRPKLWSTLVATLYERDHGGRDWQGIGNGQPDLQRFYAVCIMPEVRSNCGEQPSTKAETCTQKR